MANAATKRLALIGGAVAVVGVGVYLMLSAFNDNLVFFYSPMQVAAKEAPQGRTFRMGGMVEEGSVKRLPDGVTVTFGITDTAAVIPTEYKGILPDLFKEGKGVVAQGKLGHFSSADSVQKRVSSSAPRQSSGQSFRPSARKRPSARRNAPLDARRQAYLTFAFSRLVIFSIRLSSNYQNIQKGRPRI